MKGPGAKMSPNDNVPLLTGRYDSLYDSEAGSDVHFIVGPDKERVPGHREILAQANPVFKEMLTGPLATPEPITVEDVDGRAFDQLLRFLYQKKVEIQSVTTALLTLYAGHKYICDDLVTECVSYLNAHISVSSVLEIYNYIRPFTHLQWAPSAPPLNEDIPTAPQPKPLPSCDALLHNTLQFIDHNADVVLTQEHIEDLDREGLQAILVRSSLKVSSESVVFNVVNRWCSRECKRKQMELTVGNRRSILGDDGIFLPRYLLMKSNEFISGPLVSGLLDQADSAVIISHILGQSQEVPKNLEGVWPSLKCPREDGDVGVVPLSARSGVPAGNGLDSKKVKNGKKNQKKEKKRKSDSPSPDVERRGTGTKFVECLVGVVSCIFD